MHHQRVGQPLGTTGPPGGRRPVAQWLHGYMDPGHTLRDAFGEPPYTHVQSYVRALRPNTLLWVLRHTTVFSLAHPARSYTDAVIQKEVSLSQALMRHGGWNIDCLAGHYRGRDYRRVTVDPNPTSRGGDPCYAGAYFGGSLDPDEVLFVKMRGPGPTEGVGGGARARWPLVGSVLILVLLFLVGVACRRAR